MEAREGPIVEKSTPEDWSKEELVKKYKKLLLISKKAQISKNEFAEKWKNAQDIETNLKSENDSLKEIINSYEVKKTVYAEIENKLKNAENENSKNKQIYDDLQKKFADKIVECSSLQATLQKLNDKISKLEIENSEKTEKLDSFKELYAEIEIEKKIAEGKSLQTETDNNELKKKVTISEEKYVNLETKLKDFQEKYIEELKNYENLQRTLEKLKGRQTSEHPPSKESDSLQSVPENREYDELIEKFNELKDKLNSKTMENDELNKGLQELMEKYDKLTGEYKDLPENWKGLLGECSKTRTDETFTNELKELEERCNDKLSKKETQIEELEKNYAALTEKYVDVEKSNYTTLEKLAAAEEREEKLKTMAEKLGKNMKEISHENKSLLSQLEVSNKEITAKSETCKHLLSSSTATNKKLRDWEITWKSLLEAETEKVRKGLLENAKLQEIINEMNEKETEIRKKLTDSQESLKSVLERNQSEANRNLQLISSEKEALLKECSEIQILLKNKEIQIQDLSQQLSSYVFNSKELTQKLNVTIKDKDEYHTALVIKTKDVENLNAELEKKNNETKVIITECDEQRRTINNLELSHHELEAKLNDVEEDNVNLKLRLEESLEIIEQLKQNMTQCESANAEVSNALELDLQNLRDGFTSAAQRCKELEEKLNSSENLETMINEKCTEYEKLKSEMQYWEDKVRNISQVIFAFLQMDETSAFGMKIKILEELRFILIENETEFKKAEEILKQSKLENKLQDFMDEISKKECLDRGLLKYLVEAVGCGVVAKEKFNDLLLSMAGLNSLTEKQRKLTQAVDGIKEYQQTFAKQISEELNTTKLERCQVDGIIMKCLRECSERIHAGNVDLLDEMNEMNQVLKERGETISRLQIESDDFEKFKLESSKQSEMLELKLADKAKRMEEAEGEAERMRAKLEGKEKIARDLEDEIWRLKSSADSTVEVLSTSTISRVEEAARLAEVEESFEEKYLKLKQFAVKQKKKIMELQSQGNEERTKLISEREEFDEKLNRFKKQMDALGGLQKSYDDLQEQFDSVTKEKNKLETCKETMGRELDNLRHQLKDMDKLKLEKSSFDIVKQELRNQLETSKRDNRQEKTKEKELEVKIVELEAVIKVQKQQRGELEEQLRTIEQGRKKLEQERQTSSLVQMELNDAEEAMEKLDAKSKEKDAECEALKMEMKEIRNELETLRSTLTQCKTALGEEQEKSQRAEESTANITAQLNMVQHSDRENEARIAELKGKIEVAKAETEKMQLQLSTVSAEKFALDERTAKQIYGLESKLSSTEEALQQREMELSELKKEFGSYKVRAQSVLKSQKESNGAQRQDKLEELNQWMNTSQSLKARLEESTARLQSLTLENNAFLEEKTRLHARVQELTVQLTEARDNCGIYKDQVQKLITDGENALRMHKLQMETLARTNQQQVDDAQSAADTEREALKKELENLHLQLQLHVGRERGVAEHKRDSFVPVKEREREALDLLMLEREECEGSESVDSTSPRVAHATSHIPSLDKLLNSSDTEGKKSSTPDITSYVERLEKSENSIRHLTDLLAEAENDSARLKQLNDVLKEEIRRNQRSVEREQHAQNLEYLKNVVLKFITLQNVDERERLCPVLNTILKLSPEESTALSNAAKGGPDNNPANRGWSNYLNIWPSAQ